MGTPVPRTNVEVAVKSVTSGVTTRAMTDAEIKKYGSISPSAANKEINSFIDNELIRNLERAEKEERIDKEMAKPSVLKPTNEKLEELCKGYTSAYAAALALVVVIGVSRTTITRWISEAGIKFEKAEVKEVPQVESKDEEQAVTTPAEVAANETAAPEIKKPEQPDAIVARINTATYLIGEAVVIIDFQLEKVGFITNNLTFKEAAAVVELLSEIL